MLQKARYLLPILFCLILYCKNSKWFRFEIELDFPAYEEQIGHQLTENERKSGESALITALQHRIDITGTDEVSITKIGPGRFSIKIAQNKKVPMPPTQIFRPGKLEIKICDTILTQKVAKKFSEYIAAATNLNFEQEEEQILKQLRKDTSLSNAFDIVFTLERDVQVGSARYPSPVVMKRKSEPSATDLKDIFPTMDGEQAIIVFDTTPTGRAKLRNATGAQNKGKNMAFVFDQRIISMPVINEPVTDGRGQISGNFTKQQVYDTAKMIEMGALPIPIKILNSGE